MNPQSRLPRIAAYVPARIASKRLPRKALRQFGDKPLVLHALDALSSSGVVQRAEVNTESEEIASVIESAGGRVYRRDAKLAADSVSTEEILADYVRQLPCSYDIVAAVNPTSPLLRPETIRSFFNEMHLRAADTAFSVTLLQKHCLLDGKPVNYTIDGAHPSTHEIMPIQMINWAITAWRLPLARERVEERGSSLYLGSVAFIPLPCQEAFDIDTIEEFEIAEAVWRYRQDLQSSPLCRKHADDSVT